MKSSFYRTQSNIVLILFVILFLSYILFSITIFRYGLSHLDLYSSNIVTKCVAILEDNSANISIVLFISAMLISSYVLVKIAFAIKNVIKIISETNRYVAFLKILESNEMFTIFDSGKKQSFVYGYFKPKVFISSAMYNSFSNAELNAVYLHELGHIKYFHNLKKLLITFIVQVVPLIKDKINTLESFVNINEMASDEYCYTTLGSKNSLVSALNTTYSGFEAESELMLSNFTIRVSRVEALVADSNKLSSYIISKILLLIVLFILPFIFIQNNVKAQEIKIENVMYGSCNEVPESEEYQTDQLHSFVQ